MKDQHIRIDPKSLPDYVYTQASKVLLRSVAKALADPVLRQDFEDWKAKRYGSKSAEQTGVRFSERR